MCEDFQPRLKVAELAKLAQERAAALAAEGETLHPVTGQGRALAKHFWGSAWMKQLALCEAGGLNLAPGRTLLRHGCVLDMAVVNGEIRARVSAEELYEVHLRLRPLDEERREDLAAACRGHVGSLVSLLEGKVDESLLSLLCDPERGLLPEPADWKMACTCPDWSEPCPHAAAAIYAVGCLIDADPSLLFTLRGVDPAELLQVAPAPAPAPDTAALSAIFGIEIDAE